MYTYKYFEIYAVIIFTVFRIMYLQDWCNVIEPKYISH